MLACGNVAEVMGEVCVSEKVLAWERPIGQYLFSSQIIV